MHSSAATQYKNKLRCGSAAPTTRVPHTIIIPLEIRPIKLNGRTTYREREQSSQSEKERERERDKCPHSVYHDCVAFLRF